MACPNCGQDSYAPVAEEHPDHTGVYIWQCPRCEADIGITD